MLRSASRTPTRRSTTAQRSMRRQRITPSIAGSGPAFATFAKSLICSEQSRGAAAHGPASGRSANPASPSAL